MAGDASDPVAPGPDLHASTVQTERYNRRGRFQFRFGMPFLRPFDLPTLFTRFPAGNIPDDQAALRLRSGGRYLQWSAACLPLKHQAPRRRSGSSGPPQFPSRNTRFAGRVRLSRYSLRRVRRHRPSLSDRRTCGVTPLKRFADPVPAPHVTDQDRRDCNQHVHRGVNPNAVDQ